MLYLLSMVRSLLLYNSINKNLGWVPDGDSKEEFPEMLQEYEASAPLVNRPCGVWRPKEKIKSSFRYAL